MIRISNWYKDVRKHLDGENSKDQNLHLEKYVLPTLKAQSSAFDDGARLQLSVCIADLRVWAGQFRVEGKIEAAVEVEQFAEDWEKEWHGEEQDGG